MRTSFDNYVCPCGCTTPNRHFKNGKILQQHRIAFDKWWWKQGWIPSFSYMESSSTEFEIRWRKGGWTASKVKKVVDERGLVQWSRFSQLFTTAHIHINERSLNSNKPQSNRLKLLHKRKCRIERTVLNALHTGECAHRSAIDWFHQP